MHLHSKLRGWQTYSTWHPCYSLAHLCNPWLFMHITHYQSSESTSHWKSHSSRLWNQGTTVQILSVRNCNWKSYSLPYVKRLFFCELATAKGLQCIAAFRYNILLGVVLLGRTFTVDRLNWQQPQHSTVRHTCTAVNCWSAYALVTMGTRFATEITIPLTACPSQVNNGANWTVASAISHVNEFTCTYGHHSPALLMRIAIRQFITNWFLLYMSKRQCLALLRSLELLPALYNFLHSTL